MSKKIDKIAEALQKRFNENVIMKMSDSKTSNIETFSSGRPDLDAILGGGYAKGKIVEIYAESGAGKTGLALEAISSIQKQGGIAAIIDAEHALNTDYCEQLGINVADLYISQPSYGEQAFEAIRALLGTEEVSLIVVDSVSALVPLKELEGESGEANMGSQARMMSQGMKLIAGQASTVGCTVLFINQLRNKIVLYGSPVTTSGGKALPFYATQRIEVKNKGAIKTGTEVIGFHQNIIVRKNKIYPPFKEITNDIIYGKGVDKLTGLIEACVEKGVLEKAGAWYRYDGTNIAKGVKKLREILEDNQEFVQELNDKLKE